MIAVDPSALTDPTWQAFADRNSMLLAALTDTPQNSLAALATATGRSEVNVAPFVPAGVSSGGVAALQNAMTNPTRCLAVIPIHPGRLFFTGNDGFNFNHLDGSVAATRLFDFSGSFPVPAIFLAGERDTLSGIVMPTENFEIGRRMANAPWCMITEPNVQHTGTPIPPALVTTILEGIIARRLPAANWPANQAPVLQTLDVTTGWLADLVTKEIAPYATFTGDRTRAAWLPDAASANAWAAYVVAQPFRRPPQSIVLPTTAANLQIFDPTKNTIFPSDQAGGMGGEAAWKVCGDLKVADACYLNSHGAAIYTVPVSVAGADWIRPLDARTFTGAILLSFTLTKDADIYIAHDNAMQTKPSWLTGWTNTGENMIVGNGSTLFSAPFTLRLYKKSFLAGQTVELGPNGGSTQHMMYLTIIKATSTTPPNELSLIVSDANAAEAGLDTASFSIIRSAGSTGAITVNYTLGGTATSGSDFNAVSGSVTIPDGQNSANIIVTPINDALVEGDETVTLTLQSGAGYTLGTVNSGSITIADDDGAAKPQVGISFSPTTATEGTTTSINVTLTRTGATTSPLSVSLSLTGDAGIDTDYASFVLTQSIPAGAASMSFAVTLLDDAVIEAAETMMLTVVPTTAYDAAANATATLTIADNDATGLPIVTITATDSAAGEPSNGGAFTLSRTGSTAAALTVTFATSGTATRASDYTLQNTVAGFTYVFPVGSASMVRTLTVVNDSLVEGTETATCTLVAGAAYTLGSPSSATINITDDDSGTGLPSVTISATDAAAAEPADSGTFTVTRSGATTAALTVNFTVSGTATSGTDYAALGTSVNIPIGQTSATVTVTPIDDTVSESTETVIATLSSNAAYTLGSPSAATVNLADNDNTDPWIQQPAITYATRGTKDLKLDIYLPKTPLPGLTPVLIYIPGGGWATVGRASIGTNFKNFTGDGFAVVSIDHSNSGDAVWPAQIQDCKAAVRWLRANAATYNFDTTRFGVTGISSGGHMSAMIGTTGGISSATIGATTVDFVGANPTNPMQSDAVQAVIPVMPPTHLLWADHFATSSIPDKNGISSPQSQLVGFPVQTVPELVSTAIPMTFISASTPPFFITHGTADTFVTFNASELLNEALVRAGRSSTFWTTVNGGHDGSTTESTENTLLFRQFLKRTLLGITTNALPVASFTASVASGPAPLTVSFNGSASSDSDGSVTKYAWSFGDDDGAGGVTSSYTYTTPGIYPVTLAVRDNLGGCVSTTQFITVLASTPASGTPPTVAVDAPTEGLVLTRPANQLARATVADSDGTVATVEFILDGQTTGFDRATPFVCVWGNLAVGAHTVAVRGYDSSGNTTLTPTPVTFYVEDAVPLPTVTLTATNPNAAEPSTTGTFTVARTGATTSALTVNYAITGTATGGTDFTTLTGSASIPIGQASATFNVAPIDDALVEGSETVIATLSANAAYSIGSPSAATVNIADNDSGAGLPTITLSSSDTQAAEAGANTASVTFTRSGSTTNALTLNLTFGGNATNGMDVTTVPSTITIAAGQSAVTLTVTPIDDTLVEGLETFSVNLAPSANYIVGTPSGIGLLISDNDNATPLTTTGITFATHTSGANTRDVKLNVYRPSSGSGPWPVIIYFPGGGWVTQNEGSVPQLILNFTASGYAVVSANYVTSSFAKWPAQIQDTKAAVRWVRANATTYGFDPARIGLTGTSSGGHMAAYTGITGGIKTARVGSEVIDLIGNIGGNFTESDAVQAVAPFYPPTDLLVMDHYATPDVPDHNAGGSPESSLIGFPIQTVPEKTGTANPMIHVRAGLPPFWITHGTGDRAVDFNQSELLNAALATAGQNVTFWPVLNAGHGNGVIDSAEVISLLRVFFDRTLKGITSNQLPTPTFTVSTFSGPAPLTVNFNGSASTDPDGIVMKYSWATGDNTGGGNAALSYTYTRPGIYPVSLSVRDDQGGTSTVTTNIIVTPAGTASAAPPTVTLTGPLDGFMYARTGDLLVQANAAANGTATVVSVEFFLNGQSIAWDSKSPYNTTLGHLAPGAYTATARVSDSTGAATLSAPISFHVFGETDVFPQASLASGVFSASYYRFTDGTLNYTFERSENLTSWTSFTPAQSILTNGPQIQLMQATDPLSASGIPRRFLRINITPTQ